MNTNTNAYPNAKKPSQQAEKSVKLWKIGFKEMEKMKHMIRHHPTLGRPGWLVDETFARWDKENALRDTKPKT